MLVSRDTSEETNQFTCRHCCGLHGPRGLCRGYDLLNQRTRHCSSRQELLLEERLLQPSFMSILSKRAGTVLQGAVQGIAGGFGSLASIIGLIMGGILYDFLGGTTFLVSAGVIFTAFIMSFRLLKMRVFI